MYKNLKCLLLLCISTVTLFTACEKEEVVSKSSEKSLLSLSLTSFTPAITAQIDHQKNTATATVPFGSSLNTIRVTHTASAKAIVVPASGQEHNFATPVPFVVTAEDGSKKTYMVSVVTAKNAENSILSFSFPGLNPAVVATIDASTKKILATVPNATDITKLSPEITLPEGATISPASGTVQDFTNPVTYTVTAQNGEKQPYQVTVTKAASSEKEMLSFAFNALTPAVTANIKATDKTVMATVPYGTVVTALVPTITVSEGARVSPASGSAQDFTNPVVYFVIAQDGSEERYTVSVAVAKNDKNSITGFAFNGLTPAVTATVDENAGTITATVPYGTDVSALVPTIQFSEAATVSPASGVAQDFSAPVTYTVTAQNGAVKTYTATITVDKPAPVVTAVANNNVGYKGEDLIITGKHFSTTAANNIVKVTKGSTETTLAVSTVTLIDAATNTYELRAPLATGMSSGKYALQLTVHEKTASYATPIDIVGKTEFYIFSTNKTTYATGEIMTITGQNLKRTGYGTNIQLMPVSGGVTTINSVTVNPEGTVATYPVAAGLTPKDYFISLQHTNYMGSFLYSNELRVKIQ